MWERVAAVILTVAGVATVLRQAWRTWKKLDVLADNLLGDADRGVPSLVDRVKAVDAKLDDHLAWHAGSNGRTNATVRL